MQVAIDRIDFLPQRIQLGCIHGVAAILRPTASRKGKQARRLRLPVVLALAVRPFYRGAVEFEPTGLRPR
jgi:hypothetical protein